MFEFLGFLYVCSWVAAPIGTLVGLVLLFSGPSSSLSKEDLERLNNRELNSIELELKQKRKDLGMD
jgi:hypothetical protein